MADIVRYRTGKDNCLPGQPVRFQDCGQLEINLSSFPVDRECPPVIETVGIGFPDGFEFHVRNIQQGRKYNKDK